MGFSFLSTMPSIAQSHLVLTDMIAPADDHTQYFHIDCRRAITGNVINRSVDNDYLLFQGGSGAKANPFMILWGSDGGYQPGSMSIHIPDPTKSSYLVPLYIHGLSNTPQTDIGFALQVGGAFGCNGTTPQPAYAAPLAGGAYLGGTHGMDSDVNMNRLYNQVYAMRAALIANGIMV